YYMERKIFQHLLELKSLQIRSNKLNEAVLVKRAVDDYHKSCAALGGETGTRLRRYTFSEYTFKNFELFLYETLKALQKPGTYNFQNINEVYDEAERRLSPDYNSYEKALQCTTRTHRCLHAAHAYTGIPCAAYKPLSIILASWTIGQTNVDVDANDPLMPAPSVVAVLLALLTLS
ncbi:uncharacterized protein LOC133322575, partial [Musca vetustissima]|uniref:uncharacterized protein LOC133322575 n=1 Tax=Musca vetustissima TaxID=27455 RepID=UPI002AB789EF